jgi:DnaA family protein
MLAASFTLLISTKTKVKASSSIMVKQLPLSMWLREGATFTNYVAGENEQVVKALSQEQFVYLWGNEGVGKTHLLQAACHAASAANKASAYLPMAEVAELLPEMLEGLEQMDVIVVDDIDAIAGDKQWETALFHLYNRVRDSGQGVLFVAATQPLASIKLNLPDLQSRLAWGLVYQLHALSDDEKLAALQQRADSRGFELPDEVGRYLLRHLPRDMVALFGLLDRLDQLSLAEQRRLTIPFVKQVIESNA